MLKISDYHYRAAVAATAAAATMAGLEQSDCFEV
jgi:hypothetical protein